MAGPNIDSTTTTVALVSHLLAQTRSNISFLISHNQISPGTGQQILDLLPVPGSGAEEVTNPLNSLHISAQKPHDSRDLSDSGPGIVKAKALWAYNEDGEDPQDLVFHPGDIIEIVQETNKDWWTGRHNGCEGLFPANYVEKLPPSPTRSPLNPSAPRRNPPQPAPTIPVPTGGPRNPTTSNPYDYHSDTHRPLGAPVAPNPSYPPSGPGYRPPPAGAGYGPPPPPGPNYGPPGSNYGPPPPSGDYYQHPYQYQSPPPPVQYPASAPPAPLAADPPPKKNRFGGMGNTLATAAVGGLGFGAGSAIGSDVVNSIF